MKQETISLKEAQRLILSSQKLAGPSLDPLEIIEHLGYVQIDTIAVIERAHHHVFWTRNQKYQPNDLADLVSSRKVFEYWSHAASFLPMKYYRYSLPMKKAFQKKENSWFPRDIKLMKAILKRIRNEGAMRLKDFKNIDKKKNIGWGDWNPAKKAMEMLFLEGDLEITRREMFQKVYDLPERVIPSSTNTIMPTDKEYARFLIKRTLRHHGLATAKEIAYLKKGNVKINIKRELTEMHAAGEVFQVCIEGVEESYFTFPKSLENIPKISSKFIILSPFDNMVIQRKKLFTFFNFDYQIECYVPEQKRKFGYFCLPVFHGAKPFARIDCKADRKNQILHIQSIHYEKNVKQDALKLKLNSELKSFARFNQWSINYSSP